MALLTKTAMQTLLRGILEQSDLDETVETSVQRLQDDFNEREEILGRYGGVYDGEDTEEYEYTAKDVTTVDNSEVEVYKEKYEAMRQKYLDRFFGGVDSSEIEDIKEDNGEEVREHEEPQTFEELLTKTESED